MAVLKNINAGEEWLYRLVDLAEVLIPMAVTLTIVATYLGAAGGAG
jgi:hypothetical protein